MALFYNNPDTSAHCNVYPQPHKLAIHYNDRVPHTVPNETLSQLMNKSKTVTQGQLLLFVMLVIGPICGMLNPTPWFTTPLGLTNMIAAHDSSMKVHTTQVNRTKEYRKIQLKVKR